MGARSKNPAIAPTAKDFIHPKVALSHAGPTFIKGGVAKAPNPFKVARGVVTRATGGKTKPNY